MSELIDLTLSQMVSALKKGEISSRELTSIYLERIERLEPQLHTFLTIQPEQALAHAEAADQQLRQFRSDPDTHVPPLLGVPMAVMSRSTSTIGG